ncbi:nuclear transport factor 2 family protein [Halobacteria archaeon AArc-curdl1]|uniref:Nuclear transport factor 2 family protein n=1 Tax=Natronosalvus hydrolyticus TaxID=2979988 RepID=A0AAP2Z8F4_9EURY|nr:nuclear transport factor 2 family protein [Halobacteria archaeon AArc-curdl1]
MTNRTNVDTGREIRRVHTVLEDLYGGIRGDPSPVADALASSFTYVAPDGTVHDREDTLETWRNASGEYDDSTPPYTVDVRAVERRGSIYDVHLMTYERRERIDGDWSTLTSSVWLRETSDTLTGLEWLHLHESRRGDVELNDL